MKPTDATQFLSDLDGGVFVQKLSHALSEVAAGAVDNGKTGKVQITFEVSRLGDSYQVMVGHKILTVVPTNRGKRGEEDTTKTPMHVGKGGRISLLQEDQLQMFTGDGQIAKVSEEV